MSTLAEGRHAAETAPLVAKIEVRRADPNRPAWLGCCCDPKDQHPLAKRDALLIIVRGKWLGAASCAEHLGRCVERALEQHGIDLSPSPAASDTPGPDTPWTGSS